MPRRKSRPEMITKTAMEIHGDMKEPKMTKAKTLSDVKPNKMVYLIEAMAIKKKQCGRTGLHQVLKEED